MSVAIRPIAEVLTTLPADEPGGRRAGPTFELFNDVIVSPVRAARWVMLFEQMDELIAEAEALAAVNARLGPIGETVRFMRRSLAASAREG